MESRAVWSTVGGVVVAVCGTNAVAWAVGATATDSPLPPWPAYGFGAMALGGLYLAIAPLLRIWPFRRLATTRELLDDAIRQGQGTRDRIIYEGVDEWEAAKLASAWTLETSNRLHDGFPAVADRFLLASGNSDVFSGQALVIQTINAKMAVLNDARTGLGS